MATFKAFRVCEENGVVSHSIEQRNISDLPENDVLVKVHYSGINYKDLLSSQGNKGITRNYPHTPGIDAAGIVEEDKSDRFSKGTKVIVTGYDLGMNTSGSFAEYIRVPVEWVVALPVTLSLEEAMIIGTSGFTAALGIDKMMRMGQRPEMGPIVVSGATGGVGSYAVQILATSGFEVWASSGKPDDGYLTNLGANKVISRDELNDQSGKPLLKPRWAGAFDAVGGNTLVSLLKQTSKEGSIATCGNVGGMKLDVTVLPFILNGVNLLGINAADTKMEYRVQLWTKLANEWKPKGLKEVANFITMEELSASLDKMAKGEHRGRFVLKLV